MNIKGIIFDFDGTLFDTMGIWKTAGADYLQSIGYIGEKDLWKKLSASSLIQSAKYLKEQYSLPFTTEEIMYGINKTVESFYFYHAMPKENAEKYLSALKSKGVKMCIATATDRNLAETALKRCNMLSFFDNIFTCTQAGHGKDEPYIYEYACKSMGVAKAETAVFEDAFHAVHTAKKAGFFTIGIYDKYEIQEEGVKEIADVYYLNFGQALERGELL